MMPPWKFPRASFSFLARAGACSESDLRDLVVEERRRDDAAVEVAQIQLLVFGAQRLRRFA
jgi:hypothetical protein